MNKRNRAQMRLMKDLEEMQNDPPYVRQRFCVSLHFRELAHHHQIWTIYSYGMQ